MKKHVAVTFLCTVICGASFAQTIIPHAGLTVSSMTVDNDVDGVESEARIGFAAGVAFNFPLSENFSLQPEVKFIQKGGNGKFEETLTDDWIGTYEYTAELERRLDYLEVPLLAKYTFGTKTKFFFAAGPSLAVGLGGKTSTKISISIDGEDESSSVNGKIKYGKRPDSEVDDVLNSTAYVDNRLDIGLQFGAGIVIIDKILVDVRYGFGLSKVGFDQFDQEMEVQQQALQVTVGIPFNLR